MKLSIRVQGITPPKMEHWRWAGAYFTNLLVGVMVLVWSLDGSAHGSGLSPNLQRAPAPAVVSSSDSVAVADFNGDGRPDLAVTNPGSDNVSVLLGNGDGTFSRGLEFDKGGFARSVAAADFNGDGHADLAAANTASNSVSVLLGDGTGNFGKAASFGAGVSPSSIAASDLNGDGKLDLVVTNLSSASISLLLGDGKGGFSRATSFKVGSAPSSVAIADFNGDGQADIAVTNADSNNISVLFRNLRNGFDPAAQFGIGNASSSGGAAALFGSSQADPSLVVPSSLAVGDFDGDGKPDLVVANAGSDTVSVMSGDGEGGFGRITNFKMGNEPGSVVVGDFNQDDKLDIVTASTGSNIVSILFGDGEGSLSKTASFGTATDFDLVKRLRLYSLAVGDFNGDDRLDLAGSFITFPRRLVSRTIQRNDREDAVPLVPNLNLLSELPGEYGVLVLENSRGPGFEAFPAPCFRAGVWSTRDDTPTVPYARNINLGGTSCGE
ncbi:MAG: VCBS repeat-containing protein [Acidobacteria bacterium]|nr:VCBS repeat-containing protein [Acidobacteriota bacterium]